MISFVDRVNKILDIKKLTNYYREQSFTSSYNIKLEISFKINNSSKRRQFLLELLYNLTKEIKNKGYIIHLNDDLEYLIKLDPKNIDDNIYTFYKLKEIIDFSNENLQITNIKLLFQKEKGMNYAKIHRNLITYVLDQKEYFTKEIKLIYNYRKYLIDQMNHSIKFPTINYLKRNEIEIQNINSIVTMIELKNIMKGLLCEIYEEQYTWFERRKIRRLRSSKYSLHHLVEELNNTSRKEDVQFTKKDKVLVYALDRRCPVLLPLSKNLQEEVNKELSKITS